MSAQPAENPAAFFRPIMLGLIDEALAALPLVSSLPEAEQKLRRDIVRVQIGQLRPCNTEEITAAVQIVTLHHVAMELYRRAAQPGLPDSLVAMLAGKANTMLRLRLSLLAVYARGKVQAIGGTMPDVAAVMAAMGTNARQDPVPGGGRTAAAMHADVVDRPEPDAPPKPPAPVTQQNERKDPMPSEADAAAQRAADGEWPQPPAPDATQEASPAQPAALSRAEKIEEVRRRMLARGITNGFRQPRKRR